MHQISNILFCHETLHVSVSNLTLLGSGYITCMKHTNCYETADNSWWWAPKMPETCRFSWQNKILDTWCIFLVIYTKIITIHGHLYVKEKRSFFPGNRENFTDSRNVGNKSLIQITKNSLQCTRGRPSNVIQQTKMPTYREYWGTSTSEGW
jgi:hypothetical protein